MLAESQMPTHHSFFNFTYLIVTCSSSENYHKQPEMTFDAAITALRNHYCNPNLRELHKLQVHNLKFDHKNGSPGDFLVQVQVKATQAYPDPVFPLNPPSNQPNAQAEIDRVQNAQDANQATLDNAVKERNRRMKEIFTNAMPKFTKRKLEQNGAEKVHDLCTVARR